MANTVGVPFEFEGVSYALFLRPNIKMLFTEVHYLLAGMFIIMALISLLAMLYIARKLIKPITVLTEATKKVSAEKYSVSLPIERQDEIGELADRKSTRLNSSHVAISYAVFCLKKKKT